MSMTHFELVCSTLATVIDFSRESSTPYRVVTATAGLLLLAFLTSVLVLLSSSQCIRDPAAVSVLWLPLMLVGLFTGRVGGDDLIVIRFLAPGSKTTGIGEDVIVILLLVSGSVWFVLFCFVFLFLFCCVLLCLKKWRRGTSRNNCNTTSARRSVLWVQILPTDDSLISKKKTS